MDPNFVDPKSLPDTVAPAARTEFEASMQREIHRSIYDLPGEIILRANEKLYRKDSRMNSLLEHVANKAINDSLHDVNKKEREKKDKALQKKLEESRIQTAERVKGRRFYRELMMGAGGYGYHEVDSDDAEDECEQELSEAGNEFTDRLLEAMRADDQRNAA